MRLALAGLLCALAISASAQSLSLATNGKQFYVAALTPVKSGAILPLGLAPTWRWDLQAVAVQQFQGSQGLGMEFDVRKSWGSLFGLAGLGAVQVASGQPRILGFLSLGIQF